MSEILCTFLIQKRWRPTILKRNNTYPAGHRFYLLIYLFLGILWPWALHVLGEYSIIKLHGHWFSLSLFLLILGNYTIMDLLQFKDMLSMGQSWMLCKFRVTMETVTIPHTSPLEGPSRESEFCWDLFYVSQVLKVILKELDKGHQKWTQCWSQS